MCGITVYHLRKLMDNVYAGGCGFAPQVVAQMTLDQICLCLCDINVLKKKIGERTSKMNPLMAATEIKTDKDGMMRGRAYDGSLIKGRVRGVSRAQEIRMKAEAERKKEKEKKVDPIKGKGKRKKLI